VASRLLSTLALSPGSILRPLAPVVFLASFRPSFRASGSSSAAARQKKLRDLPSS
jgi:hypothetical protein